MMGVDVMLWYRLGQKLQGVRFAPRILRKLIYFLHSSYVPIEAEIGEGTVFGYGGIGVVIHRDAKVGRYCLISQQVTLGGRSGLEGAPVIRDYVRIGAGAKVLGHITVGEFAVIGANAVVVKDVPRGGVVAGVPAKLLRVDADPIATWEREMGAPVPGLPREEQVSVAREEAPASVH